MVYPNPQTIQTDTRRLYPVAICDASGDQIGASSPMPVSIPDSAHNDAFARIRVSEPVLLLEVKRVGSTPDWMGTDSVTGTGSATYQANRSSTYLTVGAAAGKAIRQSKARAVYQPGKSLLMFQTFVLAPLQANLVQSVGYFDAKNGIFLKASGASTLAFVRRSYVTGTAVDTDVDRSAWNIDKLDGTGTSGVTLDLTKAQILVADFEWLGVGRVRIGFVVDGQVCYAHQFLHSNRTATSVYMTNPNLPIRWEIEATGTVTGTPTLEAICASISSEGGYQSSGYTVSANTGTTANSIASGGSEEILAVRMQSAFTEFATAIPHAITAANTTSGAFLWKLVLNPTETGAGTWSAVTGSVMEKNTTRTVTANTGTTLAEGYVTAQANGVAYDSDTLVRLGTTLAGVTDVLSLQIHNLSVSSEDFFGSMSWHALY